MDNFGTKLKVSGVKPGARVIMFEAHGVPLGALAGVKIGDEVFVVISRDDPAIAQALTPPPPPPAPQGRRPRRETPLHGSSTLPSSWTFAGETVPLGRVVAAAHERSGMTAEAWNDLDAVSRDVLISEEVDRVRDVLEKAEADRKAKDAEPEKGAGQEGAA